MTSGTSVLLSPQTTIVDMTTFSSMNAAPAPRAAIRQLLSTRLGRFLTAYLEMTVSMIVGMQVLGVIWESVWPGLTGRPDAMALTMAFDMTVGMSAWMWVRRHATRHIVEMSIVMVLPFLVLLLPYWLGVLPGGALLTWGHGVMFALMGVYLAWRPHTADSTAAQARKGQPPMSRPALASCLLLLTGASLTVVGGILHPHDEPSNSHVDVFTEYAHASDWVWVHDLQFLSAAAVVAGFIVLGRVLRRLGTARVVVRLGDATASATVALVAMNMAVDGVALKHAVDAWADAAPQEQAARFAAVESVRWLEWGVNSFFTILLGATLLIFAVALLRQGHLGSRVRMAGVTGALAGGLLIVNGLTVGAHGFEPSDLPLVTTGLYLVMALGLPPLDRAVRADAAQAKASW